jgi:radical SAM enzyme (TIGR01210 family)
MMFFIDYVLREIKREETQKYRDAIKSADNQPVTQLYEKLIIKDANIHERDMSVLTRLITTGCSHCFHENELIGCSMCNLHHNDYNTVAQMRSIRKRAPDLYSDVVCKTAKAGRPSRLHRTAIEYIFAYNFFDLFEMPDFTVEKLLTQGVLFTKKPRVIQIEGRADMMDPDQLKKIRDKIYPSKLIIRMGIECSNEWIRNHWINKKISNECIITAINTCLDLDIQVVANVLFGIPGFTEEQSIRHFINTILWLDSLGVPFFNCSVLIRKPQTLQGLIHQMSLCNGPLQNTGIYDIEHAGLPWLYSLINALSVCESQVENFSDRLVFGEYDPTYFDGENEFAYNAMHDCSCNSVILNAIAANKNIKTFLVEMLDLATWDECQNSYVQQLEKQKSVTDEQLLMSTLADNLAGFLWNSKKDMYIKCFTNELQQYKA